MYVGVLGKGRKMGISMIIKISVNGVGVLGEKMLKTLIMRVKKLNAIE